MFLRNASEFSRMRRNDLVAFGLYIRLKPVHLNRTLFAVRQLDGTNLDNVGGILLLPEDGKF
ncbi:hypothetical protein PCURB6_33680 [Paenibacillus curdlanolyticus]|nr:hypothetical protein [Paenibacillus curdlanolyticus]GFN33108.1 hypothetical protein PCURB6_33680 [Paenibacillus curdlanolyticus]